MLTHEIVHDLEHLSFIVAGVLVWAQLVDPAGKGALTRPRRIGFAFALFVCGQALADVLIFSFTPLYPAYDGAHGLSALRDQQLAGLLMMREQLRILAWRVPARAERRPFKIEGFLDDRPPPADPKDDGGMSALLLAVGIGGAALAAAAIGAGARRARRRAP